MGYNINDIKNCKEFLEISQQR